MSKQALLEHEMGPEISGFAVFKEMRETQTFKIQDAIIEAYNIYQEYSPEKVLKLIEMENKNPNTAVPKKQFQDDSPFVRH
jgi:hypothetical protein